MSHRTPLAPIALVLLALTATLPATASESTTASHDSGLELTGFLGDYSELEPHPLRKKILFYVKPDIDWSRYEKIQFDEVEIFFKGTPPDADDVAELQQYFAERLESQVGNTYEIVDEAGPSVVRIRGALTNLQSGEPGTSNKKRKSGKRRVPVDFTGAAAEVEVLDGETGERLFAAVDGRKMGRSKPSTKRHTKWGAAQRAMNKWAKKFRRFLDASRKGLSGDDLVGATEDDESDGDAEGGAETPAEASGDTRTGQ